MGQPRFAITYSRNFLFPYKTEETLKLRAKNIFDANSRQAISASKPYQGHQDQDAAALQHRAAPLLHEWPSCFSSQPEAPEKSGH